MARQSLRRAGPVPAAPGVGYRIISANLRATAVSNPDSQVILPERVIKERLGPFVRQGGSYGEVFDRTLGRGSPRSG
jgi:hypothetical protein